LILKWRLHGDAHAGEQTKNMTWFGYSKREAADKFVAWGEEQT